MPILDTTLAEYQDSLLKNAGLEPVRISKPNEIKESRCIVMADNLFITRPLLMDFIKSVRNSNATYNFSLTKSPFTDYTTKLQRVRTDVGQDGRDCIRYPLYFLHAADAQINRSMPLSFHAGEKMVPIRRGEIISGGKLKISYPITFKGAIAVNHWSHILTCSQLALTARLFDTVLGRFAWQRMRPGGAQGPIRQKLRYRLARRAVKKGRNCDIHPSAVVEASYLGDNVTIGANAVVVGSYLADGVEVQPAAQIFYSTVGKDAGVGQKSVHNLCVLYPGAFSGASMQYSVIGERAVTVYGAFFMDVNLSRSFDRHVSVQVGARQVDSGQMLLGACLGHRAIAGTGAWISSGVEIPNDSFLIRSPDETLREFTRSHAGKTASILRGKTFLLHGQKRSGDRQDKPARAQKKEKDDGRRTGRRDEKKPEKDSQRRTRSTAERREPETAEARTGKPAGREPADRLKQQRRQPKKPAESAERRPRESRKPAKPYPPRKKEAPKPADVFEEAEQLDSNFQKAERSKPARKTEPRKPAREKTEKRHPAPPPAPVAADAAPPAIEEKTTATEDKPAGEWKPRKFKSAGKSSDQKPGFMPGPVGTGKSLESPDGDSPGTEDSREEKAGAKSFGGRKKRIVGRRR